MNRRYATPLAFKQALEQRIKSSSTTGTDFARRRQLLVFDRFLARVVSVVGDAVMLKGGLVMSFEIQSDLEHPEIRNEGMQYNGYRFRAECRLAGAIYSRPFGVDVAFGDPLVGEPDVAVADDLLNFAGISPPTLRLYPVVSHIAEKLHALTMPRSRPNTRVRDLPDIALLATTGSIDGAALRLAFEKTFRFRGTHPLPTSIPVLPAFWEASYAAMAANDELIWRTLKEVAEAVSSFLNPVLGHSSEGEIWAPADWRWRPRF